MVYFIIFIFNIYIILITKFIYMNYYLWFFIITFYYTLINFFCVLNDSFFLMRDDHKYKYGMGIKTFWMIQNTCWMSSNTYRMNTNTDAG